jgi:X-Pro dipeptidyl-peptidase
LRGLSLNGDFTNYFRERDLSVMVRRMRAAVLHVQGTRDENTKMDQFTSIWRALEKTRVPRKALIGPWGHQEPSVEGDDLLEFWRLIALRWFEHWLHGNDTGMMREPAVMSIDTARGVHESRHWPPRGTRALKLFASGGALSGRARSGTAEYRDLPGLPRQLLMDAEGARLRYDSAPLKVPMRIVGEPVLNLVASIDTTDTNFVAHLYDVAPDGTASYISRGYLDARHRTSLVRGRDVAPGAVLRYRVPLFAHDYVLAKGHGLRLIIASSDSCPPTVIVTGTPTCQSSGVVSDTTAAHVTVLEGPGQTSLTVPIGPLS